MRKGLIRITSIILVMMMLLTVMGFAAEYKKINAEYSSIYITIDGEVIDTDGNEPFIVSDRTFVPARYVAEGLGAKVDWDDENKIVVITSEKATQKAKTATKPEKVTETVYKEVDAEFDNITITIDGKEVDTDGNEPFIIEGRTYVPARFVAEGLGAKVDWDEKENAVVITSAVKETPVPEATKTPWTDDPRFFGMGTSGESMGDHAKLYPMLDEAGVTFMRAWPEWEGIQPSKGVWNWEGCDAILESAKKNNLQITGIISYLPAWASSLNEGRTFPIKDIEYYREFVKAMLERYKDDIKYWEVYNEFNSPAFAKNATPEDYAQLVVEAYNIAKEIDPSINIGMGCADVDMAFFSNVLKAGAAKHIDFVAVHPYSLLDSAMNGREDSFLQMSTGLRDMLEACGDSRDLPIWITEIGTTSARSEVNGASEKTQAESLVKAYVLSLAQDVSKVYWFEGRGPDYGSGKDFGIIRDNWTKKPSFKAYQVLQELLGDTPENVGWLERAKIYCFVFSGADEEPVMAVWSIGDSDTLSFDQDVNIINIDGSTSSSKKVKTTKTPVFIKDFPAEWADEAKENHGKDFPWFVDYNKAEMVSCTMGAQNVEAGLIQLPWGDGNTDIGLVDGIYARSTQVSNNGPYMYFYVNDSYMGYDDNVVEITVYARQVKPDGQASFDICYESATGYKNMGQRRTPPADKWGQYTFAINDASFVNNWGWNFRIDVAGAASDIWIEKVEVKKFGK